MGYATSDKVEASKNNCSSECLKKKKWSKGKTKEKVHKLCLFERDVYKKLLAEAPRYKMISVSVLVDRLNLNGSLARMAIRELCRKNLVVEIFTHGKLCVFKGSEKSIC